LPKPTENFRAMFQSTNLLLQENTAKRFSETHELSQKRRTPQSDVPTCTYISLAWHEGAYSCSQELGTQVQDTYAMIFLSKKSPLQNRFKSSWI
jgi:hypothetical protein